MADGQEFLLSNLDLIERIIVFTCRRHRLVRDEAEEFAGNVRLKLIENDYAVLRTFEGRSAFATFISVVIQRLLLDYQTQRLGKFHASAAAKRMGETAIELERLLHRDRRSFDEAAMILMSRDSSLSRELLQSIDEQLPPRGPKRRTVDLDEAESVGTSPEEPGRHSERCQTAKDVSAIVRQYIDTLPDDKRLILGLRFDGDMSVADIARSLRLEQKPLYRTIEKHLRALRKHLEAAGIDAAVVTELVGDRGLVLDFDLGNRDTRPSTRNDGVPAQEGEA